MQRYANVDGRKQLPFTKGRGVCPACGGVLIAKCGEINAHHWAHDKKDDCDGWSEPIGPWHLWWQNLVIPEHVEVVRAPHRADIVGNRAVVVELQHSSINGEDIAAREAFYGDMVWLFDATERFAYSKSGEKGFFSLGHAKHLAQCTKPVFLDFGFDVVQVEHFTDAITMISGFGRLHSREWFADNFLSDVRQAGRSAGGLFIPSGGEADPWRQKSPVRKLKQDTRWIEAKSGQTVKFSKWTEYLKLNYCTYTVGDSRNKRWDYNNVIDRFPEIANGWTTNELRQILEFFCGTAVILGGLLRVLPSPTALIPVNGTVSAIENVLKIADRHVQAGRLPILEDGAKESLLAKARQHEIERYGQPLKGGNSGQSGQLSLFTE